MLLKQYKGYFKDSLKTIIIETNKPLEELPLAATGFVFERQVSTLMAKTLYKDCPRVKW